jgi:ABC-2 type transport system permease protein
VQSKEAVSVPAVELSALVNRERPSRAAQHLSPLWQLVLLRVRHIAREPFAIFWMFVFPLLISLVLGLAFRNRDLARLSVAVVGGSDADNLTRKLDAWAGLSAHRADLTVARDELRRGRIALVLVPGPEPRFITDSSQPDGRTAQILVHDAIERMHGRQDLVPVSNETSSAPGGRYIDFLIPGVLGLGLMTSGVWGVGWSVVQMRTRMLVKRLVATPMKRGQFLLSFVLGRMILAVFEVLFVVGYARLLFDVRVFGSFGSFFVFAMLGAWCFSGLGLFVGCRAQNAETSVGLMNAATFPMLMVSGVFFSADHFPAWSLPAIKALPLTALNDGLRALMIDGASLVSVAPQMAVLAVWGLASFALALALFRWL